MLEEAASASWGPIHEATVRFRTCAWEAGFRPQTLGPFVVLGKGWVTSLLCKCGTPGSEVLLERKHSGNRVSPLAAAGGGQGGCVARRGMEERDPKGKDSVMHWGCWVALGQC